MPGMTAFKEQRATILNFFMVFILVKITKGELSVISKQANYLLFCAVKYICIQKNDLLHKIRN